MPEDDSETMEDTEAATRETGEPEQVADELSAGDDGAPGGELSPDGDPDPAVEEPEAVPPEDGAADADHDGREDGEESGDAEESGEETDEDAAGDSVLPLVAVVEAVLFAAREPLKLQQIARAVGKRTRQEAVREAIDELNVQYLETSRAFEIAEVSGRYQLMSRPEFVSHIMKIYPKKELIEKDRSNRLTPAALDTLSIIAYKQPVTRADIEHVRGVGCGPVLRALMERGSVRIAGKRTDLVGQPLLYGTTEAFLVEFGLGSLDELPLRNEFLGMLGETPQAVELVPEEETVVGDAPESGDDAPAAGDLAGEGLRILDESQVMACAESETAFDTDPEPEDGGEEADGSGVDVP